jgi:hypothetical protein
VKFMLQEWRRAFCCCCVSQRRIVHRCRVIWCSISCGRRTQWGQRTVALTVQTT